MLLAGLGASLSRGPILALLIALVVYAIAARRFATLFKSILGLVLIVASGIAILGALEDTSKAVWKRSARCSLAIGRPRHSPIERKSGGPRWTKFYPKAGCCLGWATDPWKTS
jgi:hypothetical protein